MRIDSRTTDLMAAPTRARTQRGVALVMALVILLILSLMGVSAMGTGTAQTVMARNSQDSQRAFEAAESGLSKAINTAGSFDLNAPVTNNFTFGTGANAPRAEVTTAFLAFAAPKRGSGYSAVNFDAANFDQSSAGIVDAANAQTTLHQGVSQIVNKAE